MMDKIQAVIFDLDGTVLDDEEQYAEAFRKVLAGLGVVGGQSPQEGGIGLERNWEKLLEKYKIETTKTPSELGFETQREFVQLIEEVEVRHGFFDLINLLRDLGIRTALATSSTWSVVDLVLEKFGLEECFDAKVTVEEVVNTKPEPDIFLEAADKLEVDASKCVVFEDAISGVKAAKRAGMKVFVVGGLKSDKADGCYEDLSGSVISCRYEC